MPYIHSARFDLMREEEKKETFNGCGCGETRQIELSNLHESKGKWEGEREKVFALVKLV